MANKTFVVSVAQSPILTGQPLILLSIDDTLREVHHNAIDTLDLAEEIVCIIAHVNHVSYLRRGSRGARRRRHLYFRKRNMDKEWGTEFFFINWN